MLLYLFDKWSLKGTSCIKRKYSHFVLIAYKVLDNSMNIAIRKKQKIPWYNEHKLL